VGNKLKIVITEDSFKVCDNQGEHRNRIVAGRENRVERRFCSLLVIIETFL
jgi:hypothetical protein